MDFTQQSQVYSKRRPTLQSSSSSLPLSPALKRHTPHSPSFAEILQGKSLLSPKPETAGKSVRAGSTRSSYRPHSRANPVTSLPSTPPGSSPQRNYFLVSDLLRSPKVPAVEPFTPCAEDPEERLKAKRQATQNDSARRKVSVLVTQEAFHSVTAVQGLVAAFESVCGTLAQSDWFNQSGRSQVLACVLHLERTGYRALEAVLPKDTMQQPSEPQPLPNRDLERRLEASAKRVRELEMKIRTSPVARLQLANAQLSAQVDALTEELQKQKSEAPLGEVQEQDTLSAAVMLATRMENDLGQRTRQAAVRHRTSPSGSRREVSRTRSLSTRSRSLAQLSHAN